MTNPLMPLIEAMSKGRRYEGDGEARRIIRTLISELDRVKALLPDEPRGEPMPMKDHADTRLEVGGWLITPSGTRYRQAMLVASFPDGSAYEIEASELAAAVTKIVNEKGKKL